MINRPDFHRNVAAHQRLVAALLWAARGHFMFDEFGELCDIVHQEDGRKTVGYRIASVLPVGWELTRYGAQWFLENCEGAWGSAHDKRLLEALAK